MSEANNTAATHPRAQSAALQAFRRLAGSRCCPIPAGYRTSRMYFVHPTIVLACERYTRSFQQRSGLTSLIPGGAPL